MAETETVVQFQPKPRLHCLACHAEGPAPCGCGARVVTVAEARELRKADAHRRYGPETMEQIANDWKVTKATIHADLADFDCSETEQLKRPKTATNPKGAGRKKGSADNQKSRRKPEPKPSVNRRILSAQDVWDAFVAKCEAEGTTAQAKLGQMVADVVAGPAIDPSTLSLTAQAKLAIAERQMRRRLEAEHAIRMAALDEEVRQKVLTQNTEYLVMLNGMEREAREAKHTYQDFMGRQTKIFTKDDFSLVMLCVHADASISEGKRNEATRLLLAKRFALTGERQ